MGHLIGLAALIGSRPSWAQPAGAGRLRLALPPDMASVLAAVLARYQDHSSVEIQPTNADGRSSAAGLASGRLDAALLAEAPDGRESAALAIHRVAYDAIALIVNGLNPASGLSSRQLAQIYSGSSASWPGSGKPVVRLVRDAQQAERKLFERTLGMLRASDEGVHVVPGALASILFVAVDPAAIGYVSAALAAQMMAEGARIKLLELDGVSPVAASLLDGSYRLRRSIVLATARAPSAPAQHFLAFLRAPAGQAALRSAGYVPAGR